jgi:AcrR family transcriptional regulator
MPRKTTPRQPRSTSATADGRARARKSSKGRQRDQEVIDAAAQIFYERGYAAATVQDIADALGMLKGSLYYYIETKEDLLARLLEEIHNDVDKILEESLARDELAPLARLYDYVRAVVLYNTSNLPKISVYYHDINHLSEERRESIRRRRRAHQDFVTGLIREAQERGDVDPAADPRLLGHFVFGALIWIYRWYRPRGRVSRDAIAAQCASFVVDGVVGERR